MPRLVVLRISLFLCSATSACTALGQIDFDRDIRPILADRCFACHGPDGAQRQAELRLDVERGAKAEVIQPGKPLSSELYRRISHRGDERMPPRDSKLSLTNGEIETIRRWISQGAPWSEHWSYVPLGEVRVPRVDDVEWPWNEIDHFVLRRLEQADLDPSPRAPSSKLVRRLFFDLTGLPPTIDDIDTFLADNSPTAYARLVDRLLASPAFGERMAASWLDVARYSDSYGYQVDRDRFVWPWRDWVIRAFNRNLPYDEFITQQLAGDLLPDCTPDQILATTFNRLHPQKVEGGSVPEEFRIEYVTDRTETIATAFLGIALTCARCHDHKYDPIQQREYYQLASFMDNIDEAGLYSYFTPAVPTPTLMLADNETQAALHNTEREIADAIRQLEQVAEHRAPSFEAWLPRPRAQLASEVTVAQSSQHLNSPPTLVPGRVSKLDFEEAVHHPNQTVAGRFGRAIKLTGDDGIGLDVGNFARFDPFSVTLWINTPDHKERAVVFHRSRAWTDAGSRGYQLLIERGRLSASLIHFWPGNAIRIKTQQQLVPGKWTHVAVTYDGSSRADGLRIYLDGRQAPCVTVRDNLYKNITGGGGDNITIGARFRDRGFREGMVDEFHVYSRQLTALEVAQLGDNHSLISALKTPVAQLTHRLREQLRTYYLATVDTEYRQQLTRLRDVRKSRAQVVDAIDEIMVMRELAEPRPTYVLRRGAYDQPQIRVSPDTPAVFPPFPNNLPRNRLGLAGWLTSPQHPLTARVAVNRIWQELMGHGIVRTPEDFGIQGQRPTHPKLLDWLAKDFMANGWDVKRLVKQIVTSATYQQSSSVSRALQDRDPENRLLGRTVSHRLPAEMLRDNALAVSGLLVTQLGGAPAKPYEVEASFKPVKRAQDAGLYRRSIYTYWKRTAPAPVMMTLDASKRDVCRVRRERTSSPLQSFVLMNGPQFVEAARMLAESVLQHKSADQDDLLITIFRTLTSRRPGREELRVLNELLEQQLSYFRADPRRAEQYLQVGQSPFDAASDAAQLAATSVVVAAMLNHDECLTNR